MSTNAKEGYGPADVTADTDFEVVPGREYVVAVTANGGSAFALKFYPAEGATAIAYPDDDGTSEQGYVFVGPASGLIQADVTGTHKLTIFPTS